MPAEYIITFTLSDACAKVHDCACTSIINYFLLLYVEQGFQNMGSIK